LNEHKTALSILDTLIMARGLFCALFCALFLSFVHVANSECTRSKAPEETVLNGWSQWEGVEGYSHLTTCGSYDIDNKGYCEADGICNQCCSACVDECSNVTMGCCEYIPPTPAPPLPCIPLLAPEDRIQDQYYIITCGVYREKRGEKDNAFPTAFATNAALLALINARVSLWEWIAVSLFRLLLQLPRPHHPPRHQHVLLVTGEQVT
jgi:hypothetical protein